MTSEDRDQILIKLLDFNASLVHRMDERQTRVEENQAEVLKVVTAIDKKLEDHLKEEQVKDNMPVAAKASTFMGKAWKDPLIKVLIVVCVLWLFGIDITKLGWDKLVT